MTTLSVDQPEQEQKEKPVKRRLSKRLTILDGPVTAKQTPAAEEAIMVDFKQVVKGEIGSGGEVSWLYMVGSHPQQCAFVAGYIGLGILYGTHMNGWTVNESVYFVVVSMSTVGYGDYSLESSPHIYGRCVLRSSSC